MIASWYDQQGPAAEVLQIGELPTPEPGAGEVRVRMVRSGVNPGDTRNPRPEIPFWTMLFANVTIRLLGSDDFSA
jgi:NADPH:quinone reductase-like Zn-dependent oxidoreductase